MGAMSLRPARDNCVARLHCDRCDAVRELRKSQVNQLRADGVAPQGWRLGFEDGFRRHYCRRCR